MPDARADIHETDDDLTDDPDLQTMRIYAASHPA
jgi:hypothetical protein